MVVDLSAVFSSYPEFPDNCRKRQKRGESSNLEVCCVLGYNADIKGM